MLASRTRWKVHNTDQDLAERLAEQCGIHPLLARLLLVRGIDTPDQAARFLQSSADTLYDPYMLDGMKEAVEAVRRAIRENSRIRIYGDYDADGISSTSLMIWLLRELDADFDYYIPHRVHEGYGLNKPALEQAKEDGVSLIITVDTGISAYEEAAYAAELGMEMVITDHHEPPERLPSALAVINPKKPGCPYPFKQLAGVGVAFKLAQALTGRVPERLAELAALGTIADLMPLTDENRSLVQLGLRNMQRTAYKGLQALFHIAGLEGKEITAGHIGFAIAPRINASGRLTSADAAVQLLTTDNEQEAYMLAKELDELNKERQRIVEHTVEEALQQLEQDRGDSESFELPPVIIASGHNWNAGVIGIAAARLLERFYRPALVFTIDPETGIAKGSARSISGFDIYRALTECADLLDHYGGHQAAAGMSLPQDRLPELQARLNRLAEEWLTEEDYIPLTEAEICCGLEECSVELIEHLEEMAPFGIGNRSPKFLLESVEVGELRKIGKEGQHLKLMLVDRENGHMLDAVGFGIGSLHTHIASRARVDVIGELQMNEWNGSRKAQLLIQDIRVNHLQVFDWRGLQPTGRPISASSPQYAGLRDETEFVILDEASHWPETIKRMFGDRPIRILDSEGRLRPSAAEQPTGSPTDLVLVQLPRSKQAFRNMLSECGSSLQRVCVWFADADEFASGCPSRERFKGIYAYVKQQRSWQAADTRLLHGWSKRTGLKVADIEFIIHVFEDLGFVSKSGDTYEFVTQPEPRDLAESELFQLRANGQSLAEEFMLLTTEQMMKQITAYIGTALDQAV